MLGLLRANPRFRLLWTARTVSYVGDSLGLVALLIYLEVSTGQALAVAFLLIAGDFVPGLLGPLTGVVGDRFDRRLVMLACEVVQLLLTLAIAVLLPPLAVLLVLVCVRSVAAQVFQPASRSAVPALVRDEDLETANSALGAGTFGLEAIGPLLAAALLPVLDIRGLLLLDAATFAVSAVLLAFLPAMPRHHADARPTFLADARSGLGYIRSTPAVRVIGLGFFAVVAFSGVDDVALVFLGRDSLGASDSATALLYAGIGIGLGIGYPLLARYGARTSSLALILLGFAVSSTGNLATGFAWAVAAALALQTLRGLGIAALDVGINTHLQRIVPPELLGRVFGNLYGAVGVAAGLSYVFGGLLLDQTSPRVTFIVAGSGGLLVTTVTALALRTKDKRPQS